MSKQLIAKKFIMLAVGLFILAFGIALSTKSGLGVSPSASLSYVLSEVFPLSMGVFTTIVNIVFVIVQVLILRKDYKIINLLQLLVVFIFSYFTDLTLAIVAPLNIEAYPVRLILCIVSCMIMAFGVFLEVKAGLIVMATEGAITAISSKIPLDFGTIKIILDWCFIGLSTLISLLCFHTLLGVREGTIIAAFLVGFFVRIYNRRIHIFDKFVSLPEKEEEYLADSGKVPLVITIEREFGSGGHEIGEKIAKELGLPFYDYEIITKTAEETGLPVDFVTKGEERFHGGLLSSLYQNSYSMTQTSSREEEIFAAQSHVIREFAKKGSCVIVGRLGSYVLKDHPNTMDFFFSADDDFKAKRIADKNNIEFEEAKKIVKQETKLRIQYCTNFTGEPWGLAVHYSMTMHVSDYGIERAKDLALEAAKIQMKIRG